MTEPALDGTTLTNVGRGARVEVAAEVAALATYVMTAGEVDGLTLRSLLLQLGLCARAKYDPELHGDMGDDVLPGDPLILYSTDAQEMFAVGREHLRAVNQGLN